MFYKDSQDSNNNNYLVLTIDDENIVRESIRNYLEDYEYNVVEAENGRTGLEVFKKTNPDIVLVDLRMPEMDGLDLIEEVKKISPDTPIIVISGTGVISDAVQAIRSGAWDYLLKPIDDMSILLHSINKAVNQARLTKENKLYQQHLEQLVEERTKELKNKNIELEQMNKKIQISEKKYKLLFNSLVYGMALYKIIYDQNNNPIDYYFIEINPSFEKLTGIKAENAINKSLFDFFPDAKKLLSKYFKDSIINCKVKHFEYYNKSLEKFFNIMAYKTETDQFITVFSDITENKNFENKLRQSQKIEAIGTLAGGIAHDFNNILFIITGYLELAMDIADNEDEIYDYLDRSLIAAKRAMDLIDQILTFSRQTKNEIQPVKIHLIVKEIYNLLRSSIPSTIEIRQNFKTKLSVMADPSQIHQVVMNLCTNATHSMVKNGGILELNLEEVNNSKCGKISNSKCVVLSVKDTGHGIPKHIQDNIFDPFFTTKNQGEGTGMGLSVVHGIIKNCGGSIYLESEVGKGTTFYVYFPAIDSEEDIEIINNKDLQNGQGNILFIDDEKVLTEMTSQILNGLGYDVTIMTESLLALNYFKENKDLFDLIITDQTMPEMVGTILAREIKKIRKDIPIILCTGFSANISEEEIQKSGIDFVINKPILKNELAEVIWQIINKNT